MQKDNAKVIGLVVLEEIVKEISSEKNYAILADEATAVNGNESMTVVICYVSCLTGQICERAIGTVAINNTCSES